MLNENFEEAYTQFNIAIIEKPNDKDAQSLFSRAKNELKAKQDQLEKEQLKKEEREQLIPYIASREPIFDEIEKLIDNVEPKTAFTIKEKRDITESMRDIRKKLNDLQDSERESGGVFKRAELKSLDDKLFSAVMNVESSLERKLSQPDSKYNNEFIKLAKDSLDNWRFITEQKQ